MKIVSVASAIPEHSSSNGEIETRLGLAPGWIERRTGILRRPTAAPEEATSDLAIRAATAALRNSEIHGRDIGLVLLATSTPDHLLPPTAPLVAHRLGLQAGAIDLVGACSGFIYALVLGSHWADATGKAALVIGANVLTRRLSQSDPATVSLFSDGAGAALVVPSQPTCLLSSCLGSDGSAYDAIGIAAGGSREPLTPESLKSGRNLMTMHRGASLFKQAVHSMADAGKIGTPTGGNACIGGDLVGSPPGQYPHYSRCWSSSGYWSRAYHQRCCSVWKQFSGDHTNCDCRCARAWPTETRRQNPADRSRRGPGDGRRRAALVIVDLSAPSLLFRRRRGGL